MNSLESYAYKIRNSITAARRLLCQLEVSVDKKLSWLDDSTEYSKEEYEEMHKELESIVESIGPKLCDACDGAFDGFPAGTF